VFYWHHYQADGITIGADNDANKTRTNSTVKSGGITGVHYTNAEESIRIIGYDSTSDANKVYIGGANGDWNAATQIVFYTAANFNTVTGTKTLTIAPNKISGSSTSTGSFGALGIGTTGPGGERKVDIRGELMVQSVGGESRHYFSGAAGDGDDGQYYIYKPQQHYKYNIDHHHHHQLLLKSSVLTLHQHFEPSTHL
jgi:hypothetical protein